MNKKEALKSILTLIFIALITFVFSFTGLLYSADKMLTDRLYQVGTVPDKNIKIIAIDEKTLSEYGPLTSWLREKSADLINYLNADPANAPKLIALDFLYTGETGSEADKALADAAAASGNVVTATNLVYRAKITRNGQESLSVDKSHIEMAEYPYDALNDACHATGFANTRQDSDGYIRHGQLRAYYSDKNEYVDSFSYAVYKAYSDASGRAVINPKTMAEDVFAFKFAGKSGAYEILSLSDVLAGNIPPVVFKDTLVFVGAYAPGMQDAYNVANQRGSQMYGVEIHANTVDALLHDRTGVNAGRLIYALIAALIVPCFYFLQKKLKPVIAAVVLIIEAAGVIACGKILYDKGTVIDLLPPLLCMVLAFVYSIAERYLVELLNKRRVLNAFKKYVAPQVVDEVSKSGEFKIVLGGENRDIAVLFVDIRGFTPMSEGLPPETVVEILNEYLSLTTNSIFKNNGTLDKFVGDATMAVFNAPFDLDDYIYRAVCTARDIAAGSDELEKKLMERFGKSVSFGIGVNCGPAVVGNIGCDFRMDYTAIGDTVNTAARLEANAKRGQVLISDKVYEALKGRIEVSEVGAIPLKGKSNEVFVYQLDKVL